MNKKVLRIIIIIVLIIIITIMIGINFSLKKENNIVPTENLEYNRNEKITMQILKDTITKESVSVLITNNSEENCSWGNEYKVQRKVNDKWEELEVVNSDLRIMTIGYQMEKNSKQAQIRINYGKDYGALEKGIYRIVKQVYCKGYKELYSNEFHIE